jgi:N-methylhydantoinase A
VTLRRGYDPRDFVFVAYGGAGPLHAALLARELGVSRAVIPPGPGHFSAFGMLSSPLRGEAVRTVVGPLDAIDLEASFLPVRQAALAELGGTELTERSETGDAVEIATYAELRYVGQEHTIEVPVPDPTALEVIRAAFEKRCMESYSFRLDAPLEVISVRATATRPGAPISWADGSIPGHRPPARSRVVDLDPYGGTVEIPVLARTELAAHARDTGLAWMAGPCVIEEAAATTLILPGQAARQDEAGNLIIEERA